MAPKKAPVVTPQSLLVGLNAPEAAHRAAALQALRTVTLPLVRLLITLTAAFRLLPRLLNCSEFHQMSPAPTILGQDAVAAVGIPAWLAELLAARGGGGDGDDVQAPAVRCLAAYATAVGAVPVVSAEPMLAALHATMGPLWSVLQWHAEVEGQGMAAEAAIAATAAGVPSVATPAGTPRARPATSAGAAAPKMGPPQSATAAGNTIAVCWVWPLGRTVLY
jgi:hypothetical protein